jgi:hypothetical protein
MTGSPIEEKARYQASRPRDWYSSSGFWVSFVIWILVLGFLSGCSPTYPKEKIKEGVIDLCKKEYGITVDAKIFGNTVAVYLPVDSLFDAVLSLDARASKKINDVILSVTRVTLSTDAKFDFYVVIAQDPKVPEVEIVYIRYVDDVKRFLLGDISRDDYAKRAVIAIRTPPQAERERILKELFSKLNIEGSEDMIKEYLESEERISGIGDISYWNNKFFLKEISMSEFLMCQIEDRIKMEFRQNRDLNKWYELKVAEGKFVKNPKGNIFVFTVNMANRVEPLYLDSGIELDAYKKRTMVFTKALDVIARVLWSYKFNDFNQVEVNTLTQKLKLSKGELWKFKNGKIKIEELI